MTANEQRAPLAPIFLISLAALAFEVMLTRYFAVASWAEYGYWVISIAMFGYSFSGVVLALFREWFLKRAEALLVYVPLLILLSATAGFHFTTVSPFNPIELQNPTLWKTQLLHIGGLYLALLPFYFLSGLYMGLTFMAYQGQMTRLYAADLVGAGLGAVFVLGLMFKVHPFYLVAGVLPLPALGALFAARGMGRRAWALGAVTILLLVACESWVTLHNQARFFEYKGIYPLLHVEGNRVVSEAKSPKGYYLTLDNFTERRDLTFTNNAGELGVGDPPRAFGLYKDGNRLTSLPMNPAALDLGYLRGALSSFPYQRYAPQRVLLAGTAGGFRILEAAALGAKEITALDSDEVVFRASNGGGALRTANVMQDVALTFEVASPQAYLAQPRGLFNFIEVSGEYFDSGRENAYAFSTEAIRKYLAALAPGGLLAVSAPLRDFPGYAVVVAKTLKQALLESGIAEPGKHLMVYRSEWEAIALVSMKAFDAADIAALQEFCSERSFDTPYFPGIESASVTVWNDLPPFTFENVGASSEAPQDSVRDAMVALFANATERSSTAESFFHFAPITNDRPFPHYVLRLKTLPGLIQRLDAIPQQEIGYLVNVCVLIQAVVFALVIVALPLARVGRLTAPRRTIGRGIVYFACLGLGFLLIEMTLIERLSWVLNDAVTSFAVVLSSMLVWSGVGSFYAGRFKEHPRRGLRLAALLIAVSVAGLYIWLFTPIAAWMSGLAPLPRALCAALFTAPAAFALGMPFPLGLGSLRGRMEPFVPLAWAINGAFSVVASPIATLAAVAWGYSAVLAFAAVLYIIAWCIYPEAKERGAVS